MTSDSASATSMSGAWTATSAVDVARAMHTDLDAGLTLAQVDAQRAAVGPNRLPAAPRASAWRITLVQCAEPMTVMLAMVAIVAFAVDQVETGILIALLVVLNISMATRQELKARDSVDALQSMQVPSARVRRDGALAEVSAVDLVPGDIVLVEAGDVVPADGRIATSASLEVAESALTGESSPVSKGAEELDDPNAALGDRSNMLFQNTSITRGTATFIVTATGSTTEMGKIAGMLTSVKKSDSPLRLEIRSLTLQLAVIAWIAVAIIVILGFARGLDADAVILLGITTAISAIPSGLPTFLTAMLSYGSQRLARAKAVVKSLNDVETLGCTSAINSDKTGTLTMDMMTASRLYTSGQWFTIEGSGYEKTGAILRGAGKPLPDFEALGYGLALCGDATVDNAGVVVGDPTEAALVVLAAKMGVDAGTSRREYPRIAEVPFDSSYKFMATFHEAPMDDVPSIVALVKGAPDVVLERCTEARIDGRTVPIDDVRDEILAANRELAEQGLRVMSFAIRTLSPSALLAVTADPMSIVEGLQFVAIVGIIDPLRPSAKEAVTIARRAGIEVRMITGDHAVTAKAIADELQLGPGVITGPDFEQLTDAELLERLPELHVFGRVAPQDKLRLVTVMQQRGDIVAMTGDAVNDAAALKKADIGVAMGSGSDVTKEAANMILTDDNFATLVHAVELGRDIYGKITGQIRYVMAGLFGLLGIMLIASLLNINDGNVLTAVQLLFVSFLIGLFPAIAISTDTVEPGTMDLPPRDPSAAILNRRTAPLWLIFGLTQAGASLLPFVWQDMLGVAVAQTMTFAILAISTVFLGLSLRRGVIPAWAGPYLPYWLWMAVPALLSVLAVELPFLQNLLLTTSLTGLQWAAVLALSLTVPVVVEVAKAITRSRRPASHVA